MNTQRLSMLSLMLVAAAGWTPSVLDAAANAAAPQSLAAIPLVFDTWVPGPCSPNGQPQGQCPPGDLFRVRLVSVADGLRSPRNVAFTPDGRIVIAELAGRVRLAGHGYRGRRAPSRDRTSSVRDQSQRLSLLREKPR